ncbi:MAG: hypothetical protein RQ761_00785 [Bacteroidales bacterium]|nr:hypothetical protein [Bacteroidales bacterium]
MTVRLNILLLMLFTALLFSCKKGSIETNYGPGLQVASDHVMAENAFSRVFNLFYRVVSDSGLVQTGSANIFAATCTYAEDPVISFTIDYGNVFRQCPDRIKRKGMITAVLDRSFGEQGAEARLSFTNFEFIDNPDDTVALSGENLIINLGITGTYPTFEHRVISNTLITNDTIDKQPVTYNSQRLIELRSGMETPQVFSDDLFVMTGEAAGSASNSVVFSSVVEDPLGNYPDCRWLRTGIISLSMPGLDIRTGYIHYLGQDTCLNRVKYLFNGNDFYEEL